MVEGWRYDPEGSSEFSEGLPYLGFADVEERLVEAWGFLQRLPSGGGSPFAKDGPWSQIMRDPLVDYVDREEIREREARGRGGLRSAQVDRMNEALEWIGHVPARAGLRRLVGVVIAQLARGGSQVDWREVKRRSGDKGSPDALRKSYSRSITAIVKALSRRNARVQVSRPNKCDGVE